MTTILETIKAGEKEFSKRFSIATFTWNGDNVSGVECAKKSRRDIKSFIRSQNKALLERVKLDMEKITSKEMSDSLISTLAQSYVTELTNVIKQI